jgi:hypothetical protein
MTTGVRWSHSEVVTTDEKWTPRSGARIRPNVFTDNASPVMPWSDRPKPAPDSHSHSWQRNAMSGSFLNGRDPGTRETMKSSASVYRGLSHSSPATGLSGSFLDGRDPGTRETMKSSSSMCRGPYRYSPNACLGSYADSVPGSKQTSTRIWPEDEIVSSQLSGGEAACSAFAEGMSTSPSVPTSGAANTDNPMPLSSSTELIPNSSRVSASEGPSVFSYFGALPVPLPADSAPRKSSSHLCSSFPSGSSAGSPIEQSDIS